VFINGTIRDYVDRASSDAPTPGGGSVSALAGALGVSMGCMAANFTVGRKKFRKVEVQVREILGRLDAARERLLDLTEEDSRAYGTYEEARALPRKTDVQKQTRAAAIQRAMRGAMAVPLEVVRVARAVLDDLVGLADVANPYLISDVGVSAILAEAALRGAKLNVEINLAYLKDEALVAETRRELAEARAGSAEALAAVSEKVAAAIGGTP